MKLKDLLQDRHDMATRHTIEVCLDGRAMAAYIAAKKAYDSAAERLERAKSAVPAGGHLNTNDPAVTAAEERFEAAKTELEAAEDAATPHLRTFEFRSMGATAWEELLEANRPTAEQLEDPALQGEDGAKPQWNPNTFPVLAVAGSLIEPEVGSVDEVEALKAEVSNGVWTQLLAAALVVNGRVSGVPLSLSASGRTRPTG
jgi:hypothetical protein